MPNDPYVSLGRRFVRKKNISEAVGATLRGGMTGGAANRRLAQKLLHKTEADRISKNVERAMKRSEANAKARQKEIDTKAAAAQKKRQDVTDLTGVVDVADQPGGAVRTASTDMMSQPQNPLAARLQTQAANARKLIKKRRKSKSRPTHFGAGVAPRPKGTFGAGV